jgi:hypothetical protein
MVHIVLQQIITGNCEYCFFVSCNYVILSTNKGEQIECYLVKILMKNVNTVQYIVNCKKLFLNDQPHW